jgi:hypothetical protein
LIRLVVALSLALTVLPAPAVSAAELVFVEVMGCTYCIRFNRQMAQKYQVSDTGKAVPLRRVNLRKRWPADLNQVDRPPYTPVFILVEDGREVGRFNGYTNPQRFNRDLRRLLRKPR